MRTRDLSRAAALALIACVSACSGGASPTLPSASGTTSTSNGGGNAQLTLHVAVPAATQASNRSRRPLFVANNTGGILVQAYAQSDPGHTALLASAAVDISSGSSACGGVTGSPRTCNLGLSAPAGAITLVVTTYDAAPVGGTFTSANQLGAALVNKTIVAGTTSAINLVIGGVLSSITIALPNSQLRGTAISSQTIAVDGLDADGNIILTDGYVDANGNPLSIALSFTNNPGNVLTLGNTSISGPPSAGITLSYSGTAAAGFTTTLKAIAGSINGSTNLKILGPTFTSFNTITASSAPQFFTIPTYSSGNGEMWFTEFATDKLGAATNTGVVAEYSLTAGAGPEGIAPGPIGTTNLWIADFSASEIEARDELGVVHCFCTTTTASAGPYGITAGPDLNMWFTEKSIGKIAWVSTSFANGPEYATGFAGSTPTLITSGPDGNLWFTDPGANKIGKITTGGVVTGYLIPTGASGVYGIAAGADGNLWFTETNGNKVGFITTSGSITEFNIPTAASQPRGIVAGPDGNMWFTEQASGKIGRVSELGTVTEYSASGAGAPLGLAVGLDNNLWVAESAGSSIGIFSW